MSSGWCAPIRLPTHDIIHFHDHLLSYSLITVGLTAKITSRTFFTAHDCLHFTGRDLYPVNYSIPAYQHLFNRFSRITAKYVAEKTNVQYIYPSQWMLNEASQYLRFKLQPQVIPNGFDAIPFNYPDRVAARGRLGLGHIGPIIGIAAQSLDDPRKGIKYALEAINGIKHLNPMLLLIGAPISNIDNLLNDIPFVYSGLILNRKRMGCWLAALDVMLIPSLQDNLPIMIQESMGAGVPVLAFNTGGIPELVQHEVTGWLVPVGDQAALTQQLEKACLQNDLAMRRAAVEAIQMKFSKSCCVTEHLKLYTR